MQADGGRRTADYRSMGFRRLGLGVEETPFAVLDTKFHPDVLDSSFQIQLKNAIHNKFPVKLLNPKWKMTFQVGKVEMDFRIQEEINFMGTHPRWIFISRWK